ncbi:cell division topological specificity factor MinE [Lichenibacterium dinghuense]|uniref:cell division topological specificity factor MinE n=1 Tax=Lichenibacterium dinghuense TaxID=2895977 RepID=UPI001F005F71|nr:cell division topological specificity factor MinE [Lichenibacterium sp. 6Y81]
MKLLKFLGVRDSAPVARERLQILLAHERSLVGRSDLVAILREEILQVIAKHCAIDRDQVRVKMAKGDTLSTLEVDLEIRAPAGGEIALAS